MAKGSRLKTVEASGTYESIGRKLGSTCKREISLMLSAAKASFKRESRDWNKACLNLRKYVPFVEGYNADQLSFMKGYAKVRDCPSRRCSCSSAWTKRVFALM